MYYQPSRRSTIVAFVGMEETPFADHRSSAVAHLDQLADLGSTARIAIVVVVEQVEAVDTVGID